MIQLSDDQIMEIARHTDPDDLPGDLPEIAELLGTYKALLLAHKIGFGRIYLRTWTDDQSRWTDSMNLIVQIIGVDDAECLANYFTSHNKDGGRHGMHIDIPKCDSFWQAWRDKLICDSSDTQFNIGIKHRLSDRWVREIQKRGRLNENQQDLF